MSSMARARVGWVTLGRWKRQAGEREGRKEQRSFAGSSFLLRPHPPHHIHPPTQSSPPLDLQPSISPSLHLLPTPNINFSAFYSFTTPRTCFPPTSTQASKHTHCSTPRAGCFLLLFRPRASIPEKGKLRPTCDGSIPTSLTTPQSSCKRESLRRKSWCKQLLPSLTRPPPPVGASFPPRNTSSNLQPKQYFTHTTLFTPL